MLERQLPGTEERRVLPKEKPHQPSQAAEEGGPRIQECLGSRDSWLDRNEMDTSGDAQKLSLRDLLFINSPSKTSHQTFTTQ